MPAGLSFSLLAHKTSNYSKAEIIYPTHTHPERFSKESTPQESARKESNRCMKILLANKPVNDSKFK